MYKSALITQPWGEPVLSVMVLELCSPILTAGEEVQNLHTEGRVGTQCAQLNLSAAGG